MHTSIYSRAAFLLVAAVFVATALPSFAQDDGRGTLHPKSQAGLMPPAYEQNATVMLRQRAIAPSLGFLTPAVNTTTGSWPHVLAATDMTSDGRADAIISTGTYFDPANDKQVHLLQSQGNSFAPLQRMPFAADPEAVALADVNLDGRADVVLALPESNTLAVYTQTTDLAAPFAVSQSLALPGAPDALTAGDFDGDMHADLAAIAPEADVIRVWRSSMDGLKSLGSSVAFASDGYSALASGDLNNDGFDDLVALRGAGYASESVAVFLQREGTFAAPLLLSPNTGGYLPHSLAVGDVNGDGLDDIVVTAGGNVPNAYLNVFLQGSDGINTVPTVYPAYHLPSAVAIADITHDGRDDVIIAHDGWRTLSVYKQNAEATLDNYVVAEIPYSSRYRPNALAVSDFNGDGGLDAAIVGREAGLTTLYNTTGAPTATISTPQPASHVMAGSLVVSGTVGLDASGVQVRIKGLTGWQDATVANGVWQMHVNMPTTERIWWLEARAVGGDRFQSPPSRHRIQVDPTAFAVADNGNHPDPHDFLHRINMRTAETALIGGTGRTEIHALVFRPGTLQLYTADNQQLGTLDLVTGAFSPTTATFGKGKGKKGTITFGAVNGLAFDPNTEILYAVQRRTGRGNKDIMFRVDPVTGAAVPDGFGTGQDYVVLDGSGMLDDVDDIAFDPISGVLYGITNNNGSDDKLVRIQINANKVTTTVLKRLDVQNVEGLTFSNNGQLYGTTGVTRPDTRNRLWAIDTESGKTTNIGQLTGEHEDYEGIACVSSSLLLPAPLAGSFQVHRVMVEGASATTTTPMVRVKVHTTGAKDGRLLFVEYVYQQATGRWVPAQPESLTRAALVDATAAEVGTDLQLTTVAGMKYIQAWAVDAEGRIAPTAQQTFVNYLPETSTVEQDQTQVYRYAFSADEQVTIRLESLQGDADLYIWSSDADEPVLVSNLVDAVDEVTLNVEEDRLYQIEVHGSTSTTYHLAVTTTPATDEALTSNKMQPIAHLARRDATKTLPVAPTIPVNSMPDVNGPLPNIALERPQLSVYAPLIMNVVSSK